MKKFNKTPLLVLSSLFLLNFFQLIRIPYLTYAVIIYLLLLFVNEVWITRRIKTKFNLAFTLFLLGSFLSMFSSVHYEHTRLWKDFIAYIDIFNLFFLYFLLYKKVDPEKVEKCLVILSILLCIFYIVQYLAYQNGFSLIERNEDYDYDKGSGVRLRVEGSALSAFAFIYGFNKILASEGRKILNIVLMLLGFSVIVLMAFRTMIVAVLICSFLMTWKIMGLRGVVTRFLGVVTVGLILSYSFVPIVKEKVDFMIEKQTDGEATFDNENYVRWLNFYYHEKEYFHDGNERLLGSGLTSDINCAYSQKLQQLQAIHYSYTDWGIYGLSWVVGTITVLGMLLYSFKILLTKFDNSVLYIKVFYIYLLLCSVTTIEFARTGNFLVQSLVLYLALNYQKQE